MTKSTLVIVACILFSVNIIAQTSYYISSSGGNDANSGKSSSAPWKNLSKIDSRNFYPGDKVFLKNGDKWTDQFRINSSGSSSNPITFGNYGSGSMPIIDGNNSLQYIIQLTNDVHDIIIDGIKIINVNPDHSSGSYGLVYGASNNKNIVIKNCILNQGKASSNSTFAMIYMKDPSYLTIDNCDLSGKSQGIHLRSNNQSHRDVHHINIINNNLHDIVNFSLGRAIRFSSSTSGGIGNTIGAEGIVRDITISDNHFTKISSNAIYHEDTQSSGNPIWLAAGKTSYNINILRNTAFRVEWGFVDWGRITSRDGKFEWSRVAENNIDHCGFDVDGNETTRYPTNAIGTHAWKEVYIEDNIISTVGTNSGDGKAIILDHSVDKTKWICDGVVIRRNICSGVRYSNLEYASGIHLSKATNCKVYNNVVYDCKCGIALDLNITTNNLVYNNTLDGNDAGLWFGSTGTGNIIKNNIFSNNKKYGIKNNTNLIYDYNCFYKNGVNYSFGSPGAHDVNGDPKYTNASNHDYQLTSGSAVIDKGTSISGLVSDFLGNLILNKVDIGAFEYSNSTTISKPSTPSLNTPSNNSMGISVSPTLIWNNSAGASSYSLQVSENSSFSSTVLNQKGISSSSKQISSLKNNTKYYWRVNAANNAGTSSWSSTYNFTTEVTNPAPSSAGNYIYSAEKSTISGDVGLKTKSGSKSSKVIYFLNTYDPVKFVVNLDKSGQWYIWGRMFFESNEKPRSSFYVQVDDGPILIFGDDENSYDKWHWEGNGLSKLSLGNLSSGSHTISVFGRAGESGPSVMLDEILLTSDPNLIASDNVNSSDPGNNNSNIYSADNGTLEGDVRLKTKSGSKSSKVIYFLNTYDPVKFAVNLDKSGQWYIWGRMFFESNEKPRSSFYLQVDNGPILIFGDDENSYDKWHWEGNGLSKLSLGNLSSGSHTISVFGRAGESGPSVMLDEILLTSDPNLIASDNVNSSDPGNNNSNIYSADNGTLEGDVRLKTKSGSKGSEVVYFLNTSSTLKLNVNLDKSGQLYAWGRMHFESSGGARNSFYIQIDNGPKLTFGNNNNNFDKWHWEGNSLLPLAFGNISSGPHTITIYGRECGETVMLDQVLLTYDKNFVPDDNNVEFSKTSSSNGNQNESIVSGKPTTYELSQNYPNPFNPSTTIKFSIPQDGLVTLKFMIFWARKLLRWLMI